VNKKFFQVFWKFLIGNDSGLPTDELSIENTIIKVKAKCWPLIIYPQMQANKWICNYYLKEKINTYKNQTRCRILFFHRLR